MWPTVSKDWVVIFVLFSLARATDKPFVTVCEERTLCCGGYDENLTYRWLFDYVTYKLGQSRMPFSTERVVQCAVELADSNVTTFWSKPLRNHLRPIITQRNKTVQVQPGSEINFKCGIEMGNLTRQDRIEYISLTESYRNETTVLLWWNPGQPANISAVYHSEQATIKLKDLSVTLNNSRYGNLEEPICVTCEVKIQEESDVFITSTRIESVSCNTQTETTTTFSLNFTDGSCQYYKKGELIWHLMRKHFCLANSQFTVQVLCEEDERSAVVVVTSSVVISEEIMSQTLKDIAVLRARHAPPPITALPTTALPTTALPTTALPTTVLPTTALPATTPISESMQVLLYPLISACVTSLLLLVATAVLGVITCGHKFKKTKPCNTIVPISRLPTASVSTTPQMTPPITPPMTPPPILPATPTEPPSYSRPSEDLPVNFLTPIGPQCTTQEEFSSRHRVRSQPVSAEGGAAQTAHVLLPLNNLRRPHRTQLSRDIGNSTGGELAMMPTYIGFNQSGYGDGGYSCMPGYHHYPGYVNPSAPSSTPLSSTHVAGDPITSRCSSPVDCSNQASGLPAQNIAIHPTSTSGSQPMPPHIPPVQSVAPMSYTSSPMPPQHVLPVDRHTPEALIPQYYLSRQILYSPCMPTYPAYQAMVISQPPPANTYPADQFVASINPQTNRIEEMAAASDVEPMPTSYPDTSTNNSLTTAEPSS